MFAAASCRRGSGRLRLSGPGGHRHHLVARHVGRARPPAGQARRGFQRIAIRIPDRAELQGQLYRNTDRGHLPVPLAKAARDCSGHINVENFSVFHNLADSTKDNGFDGLDAVLIFNNPVMVRHFAQLAEWQAGKVFDYSGRGTSAEPRFQNGECGIFIGSSATRADIRANSKFEGGYGMLPYWSDVAGAPPNTLIRRGHIWGRRGRARRTNPTARAMCCYLSTARS